MVIAAARLPPPFVKQAARCCSPPRGDQMTNLNPYRVFPSSIRRTPRPWRNRGVTLVIVISLQLISLVAAIMLQDYSRSLPNPYTNVYSDIHTWLFISSMGLWVLCAIWCGVLLNAGRRLPRLAWPWLLCSCLYFGWFLLGMLRFLATGA